MIITSTNNEIVKETAKLLQRKYRDESKLFLIEGKKGVEEAIESGISIEKIFSIKGFESHPKRIEATEAVLKKISEAKSAPQVIAVAKQPNYDLKQFKSMKKVILLEGIKDAGNLGTIIRTAAAFEIDGIILFGNTVDLFNPKTVRSTVGNLWKLPIISINKLSDLEQTFTSFEKVGTLPNSENVILLKDYHPGDQTLIMFGSEADGLSEELINYADRNIKIEMSKNVESLNLSISVAIVMYQCIN